MFEIVEHGMFFFQQEWPDDRAVAGVHTGQSFQTTAAAETDKKFFHLVICRMGHGNSLGPVTSSEPFEGPVAQNPGRLLKRAAFSRSVCCHRNGFSVKNRSHLFGGVPDRDNLPGDFLGTQTMINIDGDTVWSR